MGRGWGGGLRWAAFLRKPKPGSAFFQIWVVGQGNAVEDPPTVSQRWRAHIQRAGRTPRCPVRSGSALSPAEITAAVTDPAWSVPGERPAPTPWASTKVKSWHLLAMTGGGGGRVCV